MSNTLQSEADKLKMDVEMLKNIVKHNSILMSSSKLTLFPDYQFTDILTAEEIKTKFGIECRKGFTETENNTILIFESMENIFTIYIWHRPNIRAEFTEMLSLPVYRG